MVELGLAGATMHKADECVPVAEIAALTDIYAALLDGLFRQAAALSNAPIGIFDSGMGGLTVMRALMARLPQRILCLSGRHGAAALRHQKRRHGDALCGAGGAPR